MGLIDELAKLQGVTATGGGTGYDPTSDFKMELRFTAEGTPYNARVDTPLHEGHTRASPLFDIPTVEVPTEPSLLNYGDNYYNGTVQPPQQYAVNPTQEQSLGTPTDQTTQFDNRTIFQTDDGRLQSEQSVSVTIDGKVYTAPSIQPQINPNRPLTWQEVSDGIINGTIQPTSIHEGQTAIEDANNQAQIRSDSINVNPMSLYNRQGRADYTPQDTYNPNTLFGDPSLESLPDPTTDAYAEQDYYAEQDRQAKIEAQYQALLKAQGIKEDRRADWDMNRADDQFTNLDKQWEDDNALRVLQQLRLKEIEAKRQEEFAPADFNAEEFSQRIANRPTPTWLGDSEGPMTDENRASIFADTDDFGTPISTDDFGQSSHEINAQRQGILDRVMMNKWDKDDEDDIDVFEVLGETGELSKGTQSYVTNPRATDWWNDNAEITYNIKQNFAKAMGVGEDIVNTVMPILGNSGYGILLNPDHPKHQEAKDLFLNLARGAAQGFLHDLPQGVIDFGVDSYNLGGVGKYFPIDPKDAQIIGGGYSEEQQKEFESSTAYNLTKFGTQLGGGYLGLAKIMNNANSANKYTRYLKEAIAFTLPGGTLDVTEGNISDMINTTEYKNAVTELMASKVGDDASAFDRFVARLKNMGEEGVLGMSIPALYGLAKATKSALTDPQAMSRFMQKSPGLVDEPTLSVVQNDGRFPSERGVANMTDSERRLAQETKTSTELLDLNTTEMQGLLDTAQTQKLIDDAENKATRITLNEQKAEAKTKANLERQAIEDAKPHAKVDDTGLYFPSEQAILDLKQEKNSAEHIIRYLKKQGVTIDELEDTGLLAMLNDKKARGESVTKTGLLDFLDVNQPRQTVVHLKGGTRGNSWADEVESDDNWEIAEGDWVDDARNHRGEDIFHDLTDGDTAYQPHWFEMTHELHKINPERYPETRSIKIDKLDDQIEALRETADNLSGNEDDYLQIYGQINGKINDLKDTKQKLVATPRVDDWGYDLHNKLRDADGIDGLNDDILKSDIQDASYNIAEKHYREDPVWKKDVVIEGNKVTLFRDQEGRWMARPTGDEHYSAEMFTDKDSAVYSANEAVVRLRDMFDAWGDLGTGKAMHGRYTQSGADLQTYDEFYVTSDMVEESSLGGKVIEKYHHGEIEDVFLHIRTTVRTDANGNKVLYIEEIQSDLHQAGRQKKIGYESSDYDLKVEENLSVGKKLKSEYNELQIEMNEAGYEVYTNWEGTYISKIHPHSTEKVAKINTSLDYRAQTPEYLIDPSSLPKAEFKQIDDWFRKYKEHYKRFNDNLIAHDALMHTMPNAPLKNDRWIKAGLKQVIERAKKKGYDRVAWTTPNQQVSKWGDKYRDLYEELYGKKLPGHAKRLANEYGGKTGKTKIDFNTPSKELDVHREELTRQGKADSWFTEVNYIDITDDFKANTKRGMPYYSGVPIGSGLIGDKQTQTDDGEGLLKIKKKVTKPKNSLLD